MIQHYFQEESANYFSNQEEVWELQYSLSVLCESFVGAVVPLNAICLQSNTTRQNTDSQSDRASRRD